MPSQATPFFAFLFLFGLFYPRITRVWLHCDEPLPGFVIGPTGICHCGAGLAGLGKDVLGG